MAVTPNFGWPVPVSTDYVKDGWSAIADLGDAIDTTVAALPSGALTSLASGTYTGASAVNLTNVLSSTYKFYLLKIEHYGNTGGTYNNLRFRENTTDKTSGYFYSGFYANSDGTAPGGFASGLGGAGAFGFERHGTSVAEGIATTFFITRVDATTGHATYSGYYKNSYRSQQGSGINASMSNFTGLTLYPDSGTITGSYKLYGYN